METGMENGPQQNLKFEKQKMLLLLWGIDLLSWKSKPSHSAFPTKIYSPKKETAKTSPRI